MANGTFSYIHESGAYVSEAGPAAFAVHYLPPILNRFDKMHPGVDVRIFETPSAAIAELVESGEVEFGLGVIQTNRWDLDVEAIADVPLVLACPDGHPLVSRRSGERRVRTAEAVQPYCVMARESGPSSTRSR